MNIDLRHIIITEYSHTIVAWWLSGIRRGYFLKRLNVNLFLNFTEPVTLFTLSHPRGIMAAGCQVHTGTRQTRFFKGSLSRIIIIFFFLLLSFLCV